MTRHGISCGWRRQSPAPTKASTRSVMAERRAEMSTPMAIDELILQSYLFAGFPRALNAARMWRRVSGEPAPECRPRLQSWLTGQTGVREGEETCAHRVRRVVRAAAREHPRAAPGARRAG